MREPSPVKGSYRMEPALVIIQSNSTTILKRIVAVHRAVFSLEPRGQAEKGCACMDDTRRDTLRIKPVRAQVQTTHSNNDAVELSFAAFIPTLQSRLHIALLNLNSDLLKHLPESYRCTRDEELSSSWKGRPAGLSMGEEES